MIEAWVLILGLASGEVMLVPQTTELACDAERRAIIRAADRMCIEAGSRFPIAAQCAPASVLDNSEGAE